MQAIIMAAGKGSRLGALAEGKPKSFLEINGIRLIDYNIALLRHYGVERITIVTGCYAEAFEREYANWQGVGLVFNPFYEHANVLASFWAGMHLLTDDFIFVHADSLCDPDILRELIVSPGDVVLPVDFETYDEEAMGVRCENGKPVEVGKHIPLDAGETGEFIGYARVSKSLIPPIKGAVIGLLKKKMFTEYFEASLQCLIDSGMYNIATFPTNGRFWIEIDFIGDYEKAVREIPSSLDAIATKGRGD